MPTQDTTGSSSRAADAQARWPAPPLALVVTADDFGLGLATSRGIIQAHLQGPVTATSLMVLTGDHVRASVPLLAEAPALEVGLHLTLTRCGHRPLLARPSSGLVDDQGNFLTNGQLWMRAWRGQLDRAGVADEIAAQAQMFHQLVGRSPAYVDAHHHAHQLPIIRQALLEVIAADLLPAVTRVTIEPPGMIRAVGGVRAKRIAGHLLGRSAHKVFSQRWLWTNDFYFGMLSPCAVREPFPWVKYVRHLNKCCLGSGAKRAVVEWVVHPGQEDPTLAGRDTYTADRVRELQAMIAPANAPLWEHLRPILSTKSNLRSRADVP